MHFNTKTFFGGRTRVKNREVTGAPHSSPSDPLDAVNESFRQAYGVERDDETRDVPIFVVMADSLTLFHAQQVHRTSITPTSFHTIKAVVHAPVAACTILLEVAERPLDTQVRARLQGLRERTDSARQHLQSTSNEETDVAARLRTILDETLGFLDEQLGSSQPSRQATLQFARNMGPLLAQSTDDATRLQLATLDHAVAEMLRKLDEHARADLHVVVAGAHQARERSLGMQYFGKLLGEAPGSEKRVLYAESIDDENDARALVGIRRVDRRLARALFGDPTRLERDVLGDAVHDRLRDFDGEALKASPSRSTED